MGIHVPTECHFFEEDEDLDPQHIIRCCPALTLMREQAWGQYIRDSDDYTLKNFILGLKSFLKNTIIASLFEITTTDNT